MIGQKSVQEKMGVDISMSSQMAEAIQLWSDMYTNSAFWLAPNDMYSLNLSAAIASEIARMITIEMEVEITGSGRATFLQKQLDRLMPRMRDLLEFGCAKGGMMLKPFPMEGAVGIDIVQADQFYPIDFDSDGNITSCIFVDQRKAAGYYYTRLEYHKFIGRTCTIMNKAFRSDNSNLLGQEVPLDILDVWKTLQPEVTIRTLDKPLFAYFRYPMANNIDPDSPLGVSCYARATDLIHEADQQWSDFLWEFESGARALYVDELAFKKDANDKPILPHKRLYRAINVGGALEEDMFEEWTPDIRVEHYLKGLEAMLRRIEFTCGLAYGTLSEVQYVDKTATEIKAAKQRSASTVVDGQKALQGALEDMLYVMDIYATLYRLAPLGSYEAKFTFDDSIVTDAEAQFSQDLQVLGRVMGKVEFRMRNYKESEETAKEKIAQVLQEQKDEMDLMAPLPGE